MGLYVYVGNSPLNHFDPEGTIFISGSCKTKPNINVSKSKPTENTGEYGVSSLILTLKNQ